MSTPANVPKLGRVVFAVAPMRGSTVVRDYAGGLGFEADSGYLLPPLDLLQLAAAVERDGRYAPLVIDGPAAKLDLAAFVAAVLAVDPAVVVLSGSLPTIESDQEAARAIAGAGVRVFMRLHGTDERVLASVLDGSVERCVVGECDDNIADVLAGSDARGTAARLDGVVVVTPKPLIEDLDALPIPARHLVNSDAYQFPKFGRCTTVSTSRGCPFACAYYCPYPLTQGPRWRGRTVSNVLREIDSISRLGLDRILFRDPVFTYDIERTRLLCDGLCRRSERMRWWCETRADHLPPDLVERMASAGCEGINVGVESGDARLRERLLKSGVSDDLLAQRVEEARRVGIKIAFLLMLGFPGETRESVVATARLLSRCRPFSIGLVFPVHHPGTRLERVARRRGWVQSDNLAHANGAIPVLATPALPPDAMLAGRDLVLDHFRAISTRDGALEQRTLGRIVEWARIPAEGTA